LAFEGLKTQIANKTKLDENADLNLPSTHTRNLPLPDAALETKSSSISITFFCWLLNITEQSKHLVTRPQHLNFPNFAMRSRPNYGQHRASYVL